MSSRRTSSVTNLVYSQLLQPLEFASSLVRFVASTLRSKSPMLMRWWCRFCCCLFLLSPIRSFRISDFVVRECSFVCSNVDLCGVLLSTCFVEFAICSSAHPVFPFSFVCSNADPCSGLLSCCFVESALVCSFIRSLFCLVRLLIRIVDKFSKFVLVNEYNLFVQWVFPSLAYEFSLLVDFPAF